MANIYIQKDFLPHDENKIRERFNISPEQKIVCTVGLNFQNKYNFIITDCGIYWNKILENKSIVISSILKSNYSVIETDTRITVETDESKHISLVIKTDVEGYSFALSSASYDDGKILAKIIKSAYNDNVVLCDDKNVKIVKPSKLSEKLFQCCDKTGKWFENLENKIVEKTVQREDRRKAKKAEKAEKKDKINSEKEESKKEDDESIENVVVKTKTSFRIIFANILDVIASLCFVAAIIFIFKPKLIDNFHLYESNSDIVIFFQGFVTSTGEFFFRSESAALTNVFNFTLGFVVIVFFLLKLITIFLYKNKTKLVSILLLIMTGLTCFLLKQEQIVLAIIFIVLLYLCFQLLSGVKFKTILKKILVIIILSLVEYVVLHLFMIPTNIQAMKQIGNGFSVIFGSLVD